MAFQRWVARGRFVRRTTRDAKTFDLDGHAIPYIGKPALIANKKSAGRHKALADVEELERLRAT